MTAEELETLDSFLTFEQPLQQPEPTAELPPLRKRRPRTELTVEQRHFLLDCYHQHDHPGDEELAAIAAQMQLDMPVSDLKI